ncbi:carboxyl transferase domain-containing protein [Thermophagus sp. OGC60D27]|uniref:carboxyl transferase domain-containing protein n=1 Tax=Thermophagus sp. OGC60D27 TaxID=3458415 RepID=UPI00403809D2
MNTIGSSIDTKTEHFKRNYELNKTLSNKLENRVEQVREGGPIKLKNKHTSRGKLLVRERIEKLLDPFTPFLELSPLAAWNQYNNEFPSAGIVTGIGRIHQHEVMIIANDATVKGGTYVPETIKKHLRAQEIAKENQLPCIYLVDSGGIFLPLQAEVFPDKDDFGRIFFNQAQLSAAGIPQISIVMGSCTAGGAYIPAMSDETIIVRNQGTIFLAGPPLVKAATGEEVSAEELGGAVVHTSISGVADHLAENDEHAIEICRNIFESLPIKKKSNKASSKVDAPLYPIDDLYGLIPRDREPFPDIREIIARMVDGSRFHEFKEEYGNSLVTGFAHIHGHTVGILANNGILFSESALKGTHFIELCNHRNIPMVFLQNITGFMVGKEYEHGGIAKNGAKMVHALANSVVPFFTVIIGGSYGAGNYAMGGRAYNPRLLFMWPNAKISVMGAHQAAQVLTTLKKSRKADKDSIVNHEELKLIEKQILDKYETESSSWYSTSRLWDDGIIDPIDTRDILGIALEVTANTPPQTPRYGIFRM